jgi:hypothetical protein
MEYDDKIRSKFGVAVCLRDMGNGKSRLFFDDIKSNRENNPTQWAHDYFYTFTPELENDAIDEMQLSPQQYEEIGIAVVARLLALNGRVKK